MSTLTDTDNTWNVYVNDGDACVDASARANVWDGAIWRGSWGRGEFVSKSGSTNPNNSLLIAPKSRRGALEGGVMARAITAV